MPPPRPANARPIVTLTTDFGLTDSYVAELKGVLLSHAPDVRIVDVTHQVRPHDILGASVTLERVLRAFPAGAVHLAVVDPGVGTERRILAAEIASQIVICPDNGLLTWPWHRLPHAGSVNDVTWRPASTSATFHGRDIMAPLAAQLALGGALSSVTKPGGQPLLLNVQPAKNLSQAVVLHVDHFGNVTTNVPVELLRASPAITVTIANRSIGPVRHTYADVPTGQPLALIGSAGLVEIAVRNGDAAQLLQLKPGDRVQLTSDL